jgi:XTP/dITP diphosphohydrolase
VTKRLVIATHNKGKTAEIKTLLGDVGWTLLSLDQFENVGEAAEDADTYSGNAAAKASYYARMTGEWVLADDSGWKCKLWRALREYSLHGMPVRMRQILSDVSNF